MTPAIQHHIDAIRSRTLEDFRHERDPLGAYVAQIETHANAIRILRAEEAMAAAFKKALGRPDLDDAAAIELTRRLADAARGAVGVPA